MVAALNIIIDKIEMIAFMISVFLFDFNLRMQPFPGFHKNLLLFFLL